MSMSVGHNVMKYTPNHAKKYMSPRPTLFILIAPSLVDTKLPPGLGRYCDISPGPEG